LRLVLVRWTDIAGHGGWHDPQDVGTMHTATMETVGWVLEETADTLKVCSSREAAESSQETVGDITVIPQCVVQSVVGLASSSGRRRQGRDLADRLSDR